MIRLPAPIRRRCSSPNFVLRFLVASLLIAEAIRVSSIIDIGGRSREEIEEEVGRGEGVDIFGCGIPSGKVIVKISPDELPFDIGLGDWGRKARDLTEVEKLEKLRRGR